MNLDELEQLLAAEARARGLGSDATDAEIVECREAVISRLSPREYHMLEREVLRRRRRMARH